MPDSSDDPTLEMPSPRTLRVYNSLSRRKEVFTPRNGNNVLWYSCGPTVYDHAHIGHARTYITFDLIRRSMEKVFGYNVNYMMNITDVDDKIIKNGRMQELFRVFLDNEALTEKMVIREILQGLDLLKDKCKLLKEDDAKLKMYNNLISQSTLALGQLEKVHNNDVQSKKRLLEISQEAKDAIMLSLDKRLGSEINDNKIFSDYAKQFETSFFEDLDRLNVKRPHVISRVTDYCEEIIRYIIKIIDEGIAYVSNGSVYFDINAFVKKSCKDSSLKHEYAKLMPEMKGNMDLMDEGEGELQNLKNEKKNNQDFALWKSYIPGQPFWESPWGKGRPGWHIECSAMSHSIFGSKLDIHSGGIDLKFPHHDNEIAQCEAYSGSNDWTKYWLHSGHLNISGLKMSKSLKNFISIKDYLKDKNPNTIRMLIMMNAWNKTLEFSAESLEQANQLLSKFHNFLNNVESIKLISRNNSFSSISKYSNDETALYNDFNRLKELFYDNIADNFNFPDAINALLELISSAWKYISLKQNYEPHLIFIISDFIGDTLSDLGFLPLVKTIAANSKQKDNSLALMEIISNFRESVRVTSKKSKNYEVLKECDKLRDVILPGAGFKLVDSKNGPMISLVNDD